MRSQEELIDNFLNQTLDEEELALFKEQWEKSNAFVAEVRAQATLKIALKASERAGLPSITIDKGIEKYVLKSKTKWYLKLVATVSFILLGGVGIWLQQTPGTHELSQSHMIRFRLQASRGGASPQQGFLDEAREAYAHGNLGKTQQLLEKGLREGKETSSSLGSLGDFYLATSRPDDALRYYQRAIAVHKDDPYIRWNTAMTWLQKGDLDETEKLLQAMEGPYQEKAQQVLAYCRAPGFRLKHWIRNRLSNQPE